MFGQCLDHVWTMFVLFPELVLRVLVLVELGGLNLDHVLGGRSTQGVV